MLSILSSILGFATAGLPNILGFFQQRGDQKHEQMMAKLQMEQQLAMAEKGFQSQEKIAAIELEGTYAETYAQEREALYDHDKKLVESASPTVRNWNAMVRPVVAFIFVGELVLINFVTLFWAMSSGVDFVTASDTVFSTDEMAIVASIIGFYFGSRTWEKK
jgi:beta-xylosidase